jgi:hypothetical protein
MSGRFPKSRLVMNHREGKTITHARSYIRPVNVEGQAAFAEKLAAVVATYKAADEAFIADLKTYVDAYNDQIVDDHELPISKYSVFIKAVFAAAKENSFDVTTLTCPLFGGTAGDLLETDPADVFHLMSVALMPGLGFAAGDLDSDIESV